MRHMNRHRSLVSALGGWSGAVIAIFSLLGVIIDSNQWAGWLFFTLLGGSVSLAAFLFLA